MIVKRLTVDDRIRVVPICEFQNLISNESHMINDVLFRFTCNILVQVIIYVCSVSVSVYIRPRTPFRAFIGRMVRCAFILIEHMSF